MSVAYVKIITGTFRPMGLPIDYVWKVNQVVADYVVAGGYAILTDAIGDPI